MPSFSRNGFGMVTCPLSATIAFMSASIRNSSMKYYTWITHQKVCIDHLPFGATPAKFRSQVMVEAILV
jgi:hypothetical protein